MTTKTNFTFKLGDKPVLGMLPGEVIWLSKQLAEKMF